MAIYGEILILILIGLNMQWICSDYLKTSLERDKNRNLSIFTLLLTATFGLLTQSAIPHSFSL